MAEVVEVQKQVVVQILEGLALEGAVGLMVFLRKVAL